MKKFLLQLFIVIFGVGCITEPNTEPVYPMEVLVFTKTTGYKHESISSGVNAIVNMGLENDFVVDTISNASFFYIDSLKEYQVVVFLNTTGDLFNESEKNHFQKYIQSGGGYVGIHAAADTEYNWEWYGNLVGGYFSSHPEIQSAKLIKASIEFPAIDFLPDTFSRVDEWYDYKWINPNVTTLLFLDQKSYNGSIMDSSVHPISWYQEFDGGRSFYTGLGHTHESYTSDSLFLKHLLEGILWAGKSKL